MNNKHHTPLLHLTRRKTMPWYGSVGIRAIAIILALLVSAVVTMIMTGYNPVQVFSSSCCEMISIKVEKSPSLPL